jgi:hypothetical protein
MAEYGGPQHKIQRLFFKGWMGKLELLYKNEMSLVEFQCESVNSISSFLSPETDKITATMTTIKTS